MSEDKKPKTFVDGKHTIRHKNGGTVDVKLTRGSAIKAFCTECVGWQPQEVHNCTSVHCPLYIYRGVSQLATA